MNYAVRLQGVEKRFGETLALRGVTFDLYAGEMLAVLGPNGAGKTTLIRTLTGRARPDRGEITFATPPRGRTSGRSTSLVGLVPQELALYPDLTAQQNLTVFGRLHGLRGAELREQVAWGLTWSGLESRRHQLVRTFSGGMKRRVNLACGVLHRPRIVLLDEPTVGVDPQSRERIYDMLVQLRDAGTSFILTTHHLDEAEQRCDRIVIVDSGRVIAVGTLAQLIDSVLGRKRQVRFRVDRLPPSDVPGFVMDRDGNMISVPLERIEDLPELVTRLKEWGLAIEDVQVTAPNLHAVFLRLTGRELRE